MMFGKGTEKPAYSWNPEKFGKSKKNEKNLFKLLCNSQKHDYLVRVRQNPTGRGVKPSVV
jgi:hypothetical protein